MMIVGRLRSEPAGNSLIAVLSLFSSSRKVTVSVLSSSSRFAIFSRSLLKKLSSHDSQLDSPPSFELLISSNEWISVVEKVVNIVNKVLTLLSKLVMLSLFHCAISFSFKKPKMFCFNSIWTRSIDFLWSGCRVITLLVQTFAKQEK